MASSSTTKGRTRLPAHERREQILEAASHVFSRDGFLSGSLAAVAEEVGISEPGLLHHYSSKNELLMSLIEDREATNRATFQQTLEETGDTISALAAVLKENTKQPGLMQFFSIVSAEALTDDHPAKEFFEQRYHRVLALITRHLAEEQARGAVRTDLAPEALARLVIACSDGLRYQHLIHDQPDNIMALIETMRTLLKA